MLKILNEYYYLDLDKMEEMVNLPDKNKSEGGESETMEQHISVVNVIHNRLRSNFFSRKCNKKQKS